MISGRTRCDACGPISIEPTQVQVHLEAESTSFYSCICPSCGEVLGGTVGTRDAFRLCRYGAAVSPIGFSQELLERPPGERFTPDDLIDFHRLLQQEDWFSILHSLA